MGRLRKDRVQVVTSPRSMVRVKLSLDEGSVMLAGAGAGDLLRATRRRLMQHAPTVQRAIGDQSSAGGHLHGRS